MEAGTTATRQFTKDYSLDTRRLTVKEFVTKTRIAQPVGQYYFAILVILSVRVRPLHSIEPSLYFCHDKDH